RAARDWSSDVYSSDLLQRLYTPAPLGGLDTAATRRDSSAPDRNQGSLRRCRPDTARRPESRDTLLFKQIGRPTNEPVPRPGHVFVPDPPRRSERTEQGSRGQRVP